MRWFALLVASGALATAGATAHAQVHRCKDAGGRIIYSDAPCPSSQSGELIERRKSRDEILEERLQAAEANERKYRARMAEDSRLAPVQPMRSEAPAYPAQGQNLAASRECKAAHKELEFVSSLRTLTQRDKWVRTNQAIAGVNGACGGNMPMMQEPTRNAAPPAPPQIVNCDRRSCFDSQGGVYARTQSGVLQGANGTCHWTGAQWLCN